MAGDHGPLVNFLVVEVLINVALDEHGFRQDLVWLVWRWTACTLAIEAWRIWRPAVESVQVAIVLAFARVLTIAPKSTAKATPTMATLTAAIISTPTTVVWPISVTTAPAITA